MLKNMENNGESERVIFNERKEVLNMKLETKNGTMEALKGNKTTLEKEKLKLKCLKELLEEDKKNNDKKSLQYHALAIEKTKETIKELERE